MLSGCEVINNQNLESRIDELDTEDDDENDLDEEEEEEEEEEEGICCSDELARALVRQVITILSLFLTFLLTAECFYYLS